MELFAHRRRAMAKGSELMLGLIEAFV